MSRESGLILVGLCVHLVLWGTIGIRLPDPWPRLLAPWPGILIIWFGGYVVWLAGRELVGWARDQLPGRR